MCSKPCHFSLEGQESRGLNGTALEGTVDFVEQESVRVKLDMDVTEGKRRYAFPYLPVSGNIFYSMPEPGTRVCVYFPDHEEGNGYVIHGKRAELSRFPKPEEKEFHTAADKKLCMAPGRIRLAGGGKEGRNELIFADGKGVWLGSHNRIRLCAKEGIRIKAEGDDNEDQMENRYLIFPEYFISLGMRPGNRGYCKEPGSLSGSREQNLYVT